MKPVAVFYATREGHTQRIANHVADLLRSRGFPVEVADVRERAVDGIHLDEYSAGVIAASVHMGRHEPEMVQFVKSHRAALERIPTAFLSATLSEAGAERPNETPERHAEFAKDVQKVLDLFFDQTGWMPDRVKPVAGALVYSQYNFLVRFIMRQIAKKAGADTDTSRDYNYTDWTSLDHFVDEFAAGLVMTGAAAG